MFPMYVSKLHITDFNFFNTWASFFWRSLDRSLCVSEASFDLFEDDDDDDDDGGDDESLEDIDMKF